VSRSGVMKYQNSHTSVTKPAAGIEHHYVGTGSGYRHCTRGLIGSQSQ